MRGQHAGAHNDSCCGSPGAALGATLTPGAEQVGPGEIRVTILSSGDPFVRPSQASASVLVEVGNAAKDLFFFDLGSGALIELHRRVARRVY